MYKIGPIVSSSSSSVVVVSTSTSKASTSLVSVTSTSSSVTTSQTSSATGLPAGWTYAGCYSEGTTGRSLQHQQPDSQTNSVEACIATCIGLGYKVAGMEYGTQCFCDNFLYNGAALGRCWGETPSPSKLSREFLRGHCSNFLEHSISSNY